MVKHRDRHPRDQANASAGAGPSTQGDPPSLRGRTPDPTLPRPAVILVEPQLGENIGTAARAMANFGLDELRLVAPRDVWPNEKAIAAASGANYITDMARLFDDLDSAIGDLNWVVATTARPRDLAKPVLTPETLAHELIRRLGEGQRCGILFGRERTGLENHEVAQADAVVIAPVNPHFASLNLAQAVLLIGYEWAKMSGAGKLGRKTDSALPVTEGLNRRGSLPASKEVLLLFHEHLERELDLAGFLKPPEKRPGMVQNLRTMFARMEPSEQEVRTLRGIVAALTLAHKRSRKAP